MRLETSCDWRGRWPLERVLFALAGTMTLLSVVLALLVSPWFLAIGLLAHGLAWDLWHLDGRVVPRWYGWACALVDVGLALLVSPWFLALTAFVGLNQWLYVLIGACPASLLVERVLGRRSAYGAVR